MKIGDYVRTQNRIFKITKLNDEYIGIDGSEFKLHYGEMTKDYYFLLDTYDNYETQTIYKSSPHIIDLIEVGDYVNGEKVGCIDDCKGAMREFYYYYENPNDVVGHWEEEIKTIVTKEQFSQIEYRIEEGYHESRI